MLYVTSLASLPAAMAKVRPSHLVSLLAPETMIPTPAGFAAERHLRVGIDDVTAAAPGITAPQEDHVRDIIAFIEAWPREEPLLVHCHMGISRSTATAFTALCMIQGPGHEAAAAKAMRARGPHVQPNRLIVRHADSLLGREGRMVAAIESIGEGIFDDLPELLHLPIDLHKAA